MTVPFVEALQPDLDDCCEDLISRKARFVGIQLPDGLRTHFTEIAAYIESRTGAAAAMLVEMCAGACMAESHSEFDMVLHIAHAELKPIAGARAGPSRTVFIRYLPKLNVDGAVREALRLLRPPVGVLTTSTHADQLPQVLKLLTQAGMEPMTAPGRRTGARAVVLGCDFSAARRLARKVNSFIFIGSGAFHPVGAEIAAGKPVVGADPYTGDAQTYSVVKDRMLRRRFAAIEIARAAAVFGILLGLYPGQLRRRKALELKRRLEAEGKEAYILAARHFDPENVIHLGMDALVSTACSRIAFDDEARYPLPVLSPQELEIALGKKDWSEYELDEIG